MSRIFPRCNSLPITPRSSLITNHSSLSVVFFRLISAAACLLFTSGFAPSLGADSTIVERFGLDDPTNWPSDILNWKTSPVDLSFLNAPEKPAGKHGFLNAVQDKLVFDDGTTVRFWGTNLTAYTLFRTTPENVKLQSRRLSELVSTLCACITTTRPGWIPTSSANEKCRIRRT